jgi:hypothetical protein
LTRQVLKAFRLPVGLAQALEMKSRALGVSQTQFVAQALEEAIVRGGPGKPGVLDDILHAKGILERVANHIMEIGGGGS